METEKITLEPVDAKVVKYLHENSKKEKPDESLGYNMT